MSADALAAQREAHRLASLRSGGVPAPVVTTAWIDPANPAESALMRRVHPVIQVIGWASFAVLVLGAGGLVSGRRGARSGTRVRA
jgi:hypothetical protein